MIRACLKATSVAEFSWRAALQVSHHGFSAADTVTLRSDRPILAGGKWRAARNSTTSTEAHRYRKDIPGGSVQRQRSHSRLTAGRFGKLSMVSSVES
jgi:hypothetical protein